MRRALASVIGFVVVAGCSDSKSAATSPEGGAPHNTGGSLATGGTDGAGGAGTGGGASGGAQSGGSAGVRNTGGVAATGGTASLDGAAGDAGGTADWLSVESLARGSGRVVERVFYRSGSLRIEGQVCRPDDTLPHPLILVNHGGFEGLARDRFDGNLEGDTFCLNGARLGYVIAQSSYRGEDGSEGDIEVCHGEVDDVIAMLDVLRRKPYVDADRVGAFGGSHGGCITTQLALRVPTLRAAVDFFGPSDLYAQVEWWQAQLEQNEPAPYCAPVLGASPCTAVHQTLVGVAETAIGLPSSSTRGAYAARSPALRLGELTVPMAFFHGEDDYFVDIEQSCKKRAALAAANQAPLAWYLDTALNPRSPADVCGGGFQTSPVPDTTSTAAWSGNGPYLFIYEGQGHAMTGAAFTQSTTIAIRFLFAHLE